MANPSCGGKIPAVGTHRAGTQLGDARARSILWLRADDSSLLLIVFTDPIFTHARGITCGPGDQTPWNSLVVLLEALNEALLQWLWARPGPVLVTNF